MTQATSNPILREAEKHHAIAEAIAKELGSGWSVLPLEISDTGYWIAYSKLTGPNGMALRIGWDTWMDATHAKCTPLYPMSHDHERGEGLVATALLFTLSCKFDKAKAPKLIAGDISRKILPEYGRSLKLVQNAIVKRLERHEQSVKLEQRLSLALDGVTYAKRRENGDKGAYGIYNKYGAVHCEAKFYVADTPEETEVKLELRVNAKDAEKILKLVRSMKPVN